MTHAIYHACKRDTDCVDGQIIASPMQVQGKALGVARDVRHIIKGSSLLSSVSAPALSDALPVQSHSAARAVTTASHNRATRRNVQNRG